MNFVYIDIWGRELMFKFLHNIITTKMRLFQIKRADSPLCETCHVCEDKQHMFSDCVKVILIRDYFKDLLRNICGIENICMNKILHLDIKAKSKQDTNTAVILTTAYISTVWLNRSSTTQIQMSHYQTSILRHKNLLSMILKNKMSEIFSIKYCDIEKMF